MNMPRLNYSKVIWAAFAAVVILVAFTASVRKRYAPLDKVVVEIEPLPNGSKLIVDKNVLGVVRRGFGKNLTNDPISDLEFERLEQVLEADPFVKKADAYLGINNNLHLRIEQREPVLRILDRNGGNYYLDPLGHKIPTSPNYTARVLVATGNIPAYAPDFLLDKDHALTKLMYLCKAISVHERFSGFIQQIHVNDDGDFVLVPLLGKAKIKLGSLAQLESKLDKAKLFYEEAAPYTGWNAYRTIDLRYEGQIVGVK